MEPINLTPIVKVVKEAIQDALGTKEVPVVGIAYQFPSDGIATWCVNTSREDGISLFLETGLKMKSQSGDVCCNPSCDCFDQQKPGFCGTKPDESGCTAFDNGCKYRNTRTNPFSHKGKNRATELEWLKWFYAHADFGPCEGDVRDYLQQRFMEETRKNLPERYNYGQDGETVVDRDDLVF